MHDTRPIGLIDSGIGGFTVLKALQTRFPSENIIYLGDSLRMPYGERDNDEIITYANSDLRFLARYNVKAVLLACNTVSSMIDRLYSRVPLFSIVEAGCLATLDMVKRGEVGLIATRATVSNNAYPNTLSKMTKDVTFVQQGTKTLASVINNYPREIELLKTHIHLAIDPLIEEKNIYTLLLGCTHFPIVSETIKTLYPEFVLINPADKMIDLLHHSLIETHGINEQKEQGRTEIITTGTSADLNIFENMIDYLGIRCDKLSQGKLDIDQNITMPY